MKKRYILVLVSLLVFVSLVDFSHGTSPMLPAHPAERHGFAPPGVLTGPPPLGMELFLNPEITARLNLSKKQIDKIADLDNQLYKDTRDLKYRHISALIEMRRLFTDPQATEAALADKQKEISAIGEKLQKKMSAATIRMRSVLTPEQISRLDRLPPPLPPGHMKSVTKEDRRP